MKKIATLGPAGTFSDIAAKKAQALISEPSTIEYFPIISKAFRKIGKECEYGVLPVENLLEGFVQPLLDLLSRSEVGIINELFLPIDFSLVGAVDSPSEITKLYVQFVAKGQCLNLIESLQSAEIITTDSNIQSLEFAMRKEPGSAAIVPSHSASPDDFPFYIESASDSKSNRTRFLLLTGDKTHLKPAVNENCRTSIVIIDDQDYPGFLEEVLRPLSSRKINLTSLMSRPSGEKFGRYHFFIDMDGSIESPEITDAINEISKINTVKVIGSYPKA